MDVLDPNVAATETFWGRVFDAQSQHPASKKTDFPIKHEFVAWEYTHHNDGSTAILSGERAPDGVEVLPSEAVRIHQRSSFPKGLSTTRFHQGFQRRKRSDIRQDKSRLQREGVKQRLSLLHLERRRQRLGDLDKRNDFSLTTDTANRQSTTPFHIQPRTRETGALSEVAERAEYLLLRDSKYKFHAPAWSGKNHDERQDLLRREGLNKPKKSTLLGIGGADLVSAGTEDMFSKAIYDPAKACAVEGLVETCVPGRYTPRKVAVARKIQQVSVTTTAALHDHAPIQRLGQECSGGGGGASGSLRASSSPAALGTVFRVVPNGIGNHSILPGRGGATTAGIAPSKRLCWSRSTPTLVSQGYKEGQGSASPGTVISTPPPNLCFDQSSSSLGSASTRTAGDGGEGGRGSKSIFAKRLHAVTMTGNLPNDKGDRYSANEGGSTAGKSGRGNRGLTRSQSDFGSGGRTGGWERGGRSGENAAFVHDSSLANHAQVSTTTSGTNLARLGHSTSRGASPAQRRMNEQLALDLAVVRSLRN